MDFRNIAEQVWAFVAYIATTNPYALPFWLAIVWILLLLNWQTTVRLIWRSLHLIEDLVLQRQLFSKIEKPLKGLLLILALLPFLPFIPAPLGAALTKAAGLAIPVLGVYVLVQFFDTIFFTWYLGQHKDKNIPTVLRLVVLSAVYVMFGLAFLEWALGINILPLIATSTVLTAVLGLALQDTLKNLFAGLTMSFERRFVQGDWIMFRIDANNTTTGEVVEIGWRTTKLRTIDNNFAVIPNAMFTTNQLINYSQPTPAFPRVLDIPVRFNIPLAELKASLSASTAKTAGVLPEPAPEVLVNAVRTDHMVFRVRFWVSDYSRGDAVASAVIEQAYANLERMHAVPAVVAVAATP
jgi:small-conductance mechanosensitive channel